MKFWWYYCDASWTVKYVNIWNICISIKQYLPRYQEMQNHTWILSILRVEASNFTLQLNFKELPFSYFGIVPGLNVKCPPPYTHWARVFELLPPSQWSFLKQQKLWDSQMGCSIVGSGFRAVSFSGLFPLQWEK